MIHITCSACGLQFESTGRGARCPSCGTKVRGASGTLPPLPAGLQHHSTAVEPHQHDHFRTGLATASVLFFLIGLLIAVTGMIDSNFWLVAIGAVLVGSAAGSAVVTSFWHNDDQARFRRVIAESPLLVGVAMLAALVAYVMYLSALAIWRLAEFSPVAWVVMLVGLLALAYLTRIGRVVNLRVVHVDFHSVRTTVWQWWGPHPPTG